ncbi:phage P2 baseplate assembly protein gpV [Burkholderia aenigmatica]|uniref:Phage P2 baseplate assembly protein gpV n=1 Tax=Burkholderia aenigmatica TaxID=2015348 RepID=A0ABY6XVI3_9BURK|nr:Gp138 family membrane-puncturing spike protein [Burkholderia aenigmatica]VWC89788.1 phage P2 baseplate assembly protein gpV [Burkholderia aenigmatica]
MPASNNGYNGQQTPSSSGSDFNAQTFMVWSILATVRTMQVVKVVGVTNNGGVSPVGFVDILPLVNQIDGAGNAEPHGVIYRCPYFRIQGGANALILDPQEGDIGWAGFADRDISSAVVSKGQANPASRRMFDMADAVYWGGIVNGTPNQYIAFSSSGITMVSPTKITAKAPIFEVDAPSIVLNGNMSQGTGSTSYPATLQGPITVVNDLTAAGKSVSTHTHLENGAGHQTNPPT